MKCLTAIERKDYAPAAKTVVHMTSAHQRPDDPRIFWKECRTLAAAGYVVHLIAPNATHTTDMGVRIWGIPARPLGGRLGRMTASVFEVYRRARALAADLYHFHDPELMPVALLLSASGAPVVYDVHEDLAASVPDKEWIPLHLRGLTHWIVSRAEPAGADRLAAVVAATPVIAERFLHCKCRVVTVNNYPQLSEFQHVARLRDNGDPSVCYVGRIDEVRGIETLVEAVAKTDARLLLAGSIQPARFADHLRTLPGWSRVVNFGHVDRPTVAEIIGRSRAGLVTLQPVARYLRSQPTKLFEYMAAGLPVIASDFPAWRAIIEGHDCGICVDPLDADAVAEAIRWIVAHPREARQMGENGLRAARTTYNWEAEGRKLIALYEQILGA